MVFRVIISTRNKIILGIKIKENIRHQSLNFCFLSVRHLSWNILSVSVSLIYFFEQEEWSIFDANYYVAGYHPSKLHGTRKRKINGAYNKQTTDPSFYWTGSRCLLTLRSTWCDTAVLFGMQTVPVLVPRRHWQWWRKVNFNREGYEKNRTIWAFLC